LAARKALWFCVKTSAITASPDYSSLNETRFVFANTGIWRLNWEEIGTPPPTPISCQVSDFLVIEVGGIREPFSRFRNQSRSNFSEVIKIGPGARKEDANSSSRYCESSCNLDQHEAPSTSVPFT